MTALDFKNNNSFSTWAMKHLAINEDEQGNVIVSCPDKDGRWYRIVCEETKTNITPVSCSCGHDHCKHQAAVTAFYARIYKQPATPVVAEPQVVVEQFDGSRPLTTQEWKAILKRNNAWQKAEKAKDWALIERARKLSKARAS